MVCSRCVCGFHYFILYELGFFQGGGPGLYSDSGLLELILICVQRGFCWLLIPWKLEFHHENSRRFFGRSALAHRVNNLFQFPLTSSFDLCVELFSFDLPIRMVVIQWHLADSLLEFLWGFWEYRLEFNEKRIFYSILEITFSFKRFWWKSKFCSLGRISIFYQNWRYLLDDVDFKLLTQCWNITIQVSKVTG